MVMSLSNQNDKMADIMKTTTDEMKSMKESILKLQQRVNQQESEEKGVKVAHAQSKLEGDSSEIFKELAWREERSKELILFKIDESEFHGTKPKLMNKLN
jgi:hypothetical protein